jgi:hypothetical protein
MCHTFKSFCDFVSVSFACSANVKRTHIGDFEQILRVNLLQTCLQIHGQEHHEQQQLK